MILNLKVVCWADCLHMLSFKYNKIYCHIIMNTRNIVRQPKTKIDYVGYKIWQTNLEKKKGKRKRNSILGWSLDFHSFTPLQILLDSYKLAFKTCTLQNRINAILIYL